MSLEVKVELQNRANATINEYWRRFANALADYLGKKVVLASGKLPMALKKEFDVHLWQLRELNSNEEFAYTGLVRLSSTFITLDVSVRGNERSGHTIYMMSSIILGSLKGEILEEVYELREPLRTNYTIDEIRNLQREWANKSQDLRLLEEKLQAFGKYLRWTTSTQKKRLTFA